MRKIPVFFRITALLLAIAVMSPAGAQAQDEKGGSIGIEWMKPSVDDTNLLNSAFFFGYTRKMGTDYTLSVGLPLAIFDPDTDLVDGETVIGNPRIGITKSTGGSLSYSLGLSIPVADEDKGFALGTGILADPFRQGAFAPDTWTVDGMVSYTKPSEGGVSFFAGAGPVITVPTDDQFDTEVFVNFYAAGMYGMDQFQFGAGIVGSFWATQEDPDMWIGDDTFVYQAVVGGVYNTGSVNPGLWVAIPLSEDYKDAVSTVFGVSIGIPIP
jgi:hypothetical protein